MTSKVATQLIRAARSRAGLSQAELARRAGTTRSVVNAYERGTRDPTATALDRLLRAAGMRLAAEQVSTVDEARAGRKLAEALALAEVLPQRRRPARLRYPRLAPK